MTQRRLPLAWIWAASIVMVWLAVAAALEQSPLIMQSSQALTAYGAFKGLWLTPVTMWKLIAAQWLHVHVGHMLLNAVVIGVVGTALSRRLTPPTILLVGILGGAGAQWIGALADPDGFVSGASPASLVLAGAALRLLPGRAPAWWVALADVAIAVALDAHVDGRLKVGHLAGLLIGVAAAIAVGRQRVR